MLIENNWFMRFYLSAIAVAIVTCNTSLLASVEKTGNVTGLKNIALGKSYTMSLPPNDSLCTDEGDKTDLTDGKVYYDDQQEKDALWIQKSAVGWSTVEPVCVTVDLGRVEPIIGVSLHTGAGVGGVYWPRVIVVQVSEDGNDFYFVCDLIRADENDPPDAYIGCRQHTYRTTGLCTKGRYVRFEMLSIGNLHLADEIEVYRGHDSFLETNYSGKSFQDSKIIDPNQLTKLGCYLRMRRDLCQVRRAIENEKPKDSDKLLAELKDIMTQIESQDFPANVESFRAIVPYNDVHQRIFKVYSSILADQGVSAITLWHTPPYKMLSLYEKPSAQEAELKIVMAQNERRSEVFNITNASPEARVFNFKIEGLPGGTNPAYIIPHQVEYVDGREGQVVASALVPLEQKNGVFTSNVAAGMTRQIWLSVNRPQIEAANYAGKITLIFGAENRQIDLKLSIAPIRIPTQLDCLLGMWDYVATMELPAITKENRSAAINDMKDHLVDIVWGGEKAVPQVTPKDFDANGHLIGSLDFSGWDDFVKTWPNVRYYAVGLSYDPESG